MFRKLPTLALAALLLFPTALAFAAEEVPPIVANSAPAGLGILILLIGLAAVGLVGLTIYGRMMPARTGIAFDDDELIPDDKLE